jgi:hypothetical protein
MAGGFKTTPLLKCPKAKKAKPKFEISQLMSSLDSHGLGFITRKMSSLRVCAAYSSTASQRALMILAYLGQTHEVLRTDLRAKHQL